MSLDTQKPLFFDWSQRVGESVLDLPFEEGLPSIEKAKVLTSWVRSHSDKYIQHYVKLYHGTDINLPIEQEGLKPTSNTRRRSFQSTNGYVYLLQIPQSVQSVLGGLVMVGGVLSMKSLYWCKKFCQIKISYPINVLWVTM
jgi:hypothetical protein